MNTVHYINIDYKTLFMTAFLKKIFLPLVLLSFSLAASSQDVLTGYIRQGLANNLVLKEKNIELQKSLISLKQAKSLFLPTTWFQAEYTLAKGGRSIDIPVGDLLNPVYKTLNQLTGSNSYPVIGNASEQLLPNNFYDVRVKTTMPLLNPDLQVNRNITREQTRLKENEIEIYKRELVKEIKLAYYNYLMATQATGIYNSALEVVNQNLRVNKSLFANGKGLTAYVARAESEVSAVESQLQQSVNNQLNAKAYFNFLLNKGLEDSVAVDNIELVNFGIAVPVSTEAREELKSLSLAASINNHVLKGNRAFRSPRLNAFLDLSAQGFDFRVKRQSFFYLGGLQLQVPIFTGHRNQYRIRQSELDAGAIQVQTEQVKQQLQMAALVSRNNATTAYTNYTASLRQEEAARKYFTLIDRGYKEGVNSFIEFLDARNQLTASKLQVNINKYRVLAAMADYERQTATYSFN
jgi:outer membrane protein